MTLVPHSVGHPLAIVSSSIGDIVRAANDAVRARAAFDSLPNVRLESTHA